MCQWKIISKHVLVFHKKEKKIVKKSHFSMEEMEKKDNKKICIDL